MEQQFKVGDIVQVATMENLPNESRNWALGEGLKLGIDYTVESAEGGWVIIKEGTNKFSHRESRFKLKSSNMELKITKDKVLAAAAKCSTAKATLETLFPEAFEEEKEDIVFDEQFGMPGLKYKNGRHLVWLSPSKKDIYLDKSQSWSIVDEGTVLKLIPTRKTS
jgi:hypothetical protein